MTPDTQPWKIVAAYLSGSLTDSDKVNFERWLNESAGNRNFFNEAQKIWGSSGVKLRLQNVSTDEQWMELKNWIENSKGFGRIIPFPWSLSGQTFLKVAASFVLVSIAVYMLTRLSGNEIRVSTNDEVTMIYLPDSTKVWLNVNSQLTYPKKFDKNFRNVELEGEGYFMVRGDVSRSFTVSTSLTNATALGTSFNIKEEESKKVTLAVAEGSVNFSVRDSLPQQNTIVKPREKAVFTRKEKKLVRSKNYDLGFATWREKNNPAYEAEEKKPSAYLASSYTWRKNKINQSVVEGKLKNKASLATYMKTVLRVNYKKPDGTVTTVRFTINDKIRPGQQIEYRRRLLDILVDTRSIRVDVESAEVVSNMVY